ncbi:MAG TPA: hypothetical protein VIV60_34200 [Polyangiaceae bacterium]
MATGSSSARHTPGRLGNGLARVLACLDVQLLTARKTHLLLLFPLLGLAFASHFRGDWIWDDVYLVQRNRHFDGLVGLKWLLTHDLWASAGFPRSDLYHPLPMAYIWATIQLVGKSLVLLRCGNLLIHAANSLLFARWLRRVGVPAWGATWAALVVALHPITTEPVMWITGSHDLLATLCCLSALLVWTNPCRPLTPLRVGTATLLFGLAALCKEPYFTFPAVLASSTMLAQRLRPKRIQLFYLLGPAGVIVLVILLRQALMIRTGSDQIRVPLLSHLRNFATISWHYLAIDCSFGNGPTTQNFRTLGLGASAMVLTGIGLVTLALWFWMRPRQQFGALALFGWIWFLVALSPHVVAMPVIGMFGNRYGYFPLFGFVTLATAVLSHYVPRWKLAAFARFKWVIVAPVLLLTLFTAAEARLWKSNETLFAADVLRDSMDPKSLYHYGHALLAPAGCEAALPFFEQSSNIDPAYGRAWHNRAGCLIQLNRPAEALHSALRSMELQPRDAGAAYNLALALFATGRTSAGTERLRYALTLAPNHSEALHLAAKLGIETRVGQPELAP